MKTKTRTREEIIKNIKEIISTIPTENLGDIEMIVKSFLSESKTIKIDEEDK